MLNRHDGEAARRTAAQELARLSTAAAERAPIEAGKVQAVEAAVIELCRDGLDLNLLRKTARLYMQIGEEERAANLFELVLRGDPRDAQASHQVSRALERKGDLAGALAVAERALGQEKPALGQYFRIISLRLRLRDFGGAEAVLGTARAWYPRAESLAELSLSLLTESGRNAEAFAMARRAAGSGCGNIALSFKIYHILHKGGAPQEERDAARSRLQHLIGQSPEAALWQARLCKTEGDLAGALRQLDLMLDRFPGHAAATRERALVAVALGAWGRHAKILHDARSSAEAGSKLGLALDKVDSFFTALGASLAQAAASPSKFSDVMALGGIVRHVATQAPVAAGDQDRRGLVMVGGSLASGGAERILATCYRHFRDSGFLGGTKLYLFEFEEDGPSGFYFPLTGARAADIDVLAPPDEPRPPFAWLPRDFDQRTQAIHERLLRDRPLTVHAWLDQANICAGVAALLAGVPRIVLHTHNLRPTMLSLNSPHIANFDACYQALLEREEVNLIGCAEASVRDYLEWIGAADMRRAFTVHNGLDFTLFDAPPSAEERRCQRQELGIPAGAPVVGGAFRFAKVKRPRRWLEAARAIARARPDVHFVLYGEGELRPAMLAYARQLGLGQVVRMPGQVADLHRRLPMFDLFVLSSRTEALPNVLIEAQAAGVPVVAYDVGGVRETMQAGRTGLLVAEDTAEALAAAVVRALNDAPWRRQAADLGHRYVRAAFSIDAMIARLKHVLAGAKG